VSVHSSQAVEMRKIPPHLPAVLVLGAVSQIAQVLFLREFLMVFQGSELSIGIILATWLVWVGLGSHVGASLAERNARPALLLACSAAGLALTLPGTILLIRVLRIFYPGPPGSYLSLLEMTAASFLLMAPTCFLLGGQFVLLAKIWRESQRAHDASGAEKTYVGEAVGNMSGGLLFTFLIVHLFNSFQAAILASVLMLVGLVFLTREHFPLTGRSRLVYLAILSLSAFAFLYANELDAWAYRKQWESFMPQHHLIETRQSKHGTVSVVQYEQQYSFFQSGQLIFTSAGPGATSAGSLEDQEAVIFAHFSMVQHENPRNVLLIGGGLRGTLGEIIKHPLERVDYIELDEALTTVARPYISTVTSQALADPRVRLIHTDGRLFVKSSNEKYDLIIIDVPDPATAVLNRYYTKEFFGEAADLLNPEGVFVIGAESTADLRGLAISNRNATLYHTLASVFPHLALAGERFIYLFASHSAEQVSLDPGRLQERYLARDIQAPGFSPQYYFTLLEETQLKRVNWLVRHHGRNPEAHLLGPVGVPLIIDPLPEQERIEKNLPQVQKQYFINSDLKPIGYYYTLMYIDDLTHAESSATLNWLLQFQFWWTLPLFVVPLAIVSVLRIAPRKKGGRPDTYLALLFTVFTTGFSTMALQVALLFSFQSIYGFIYELVGLIVALFMGGLALGTFITHRHVKNKTNIPTLAGIQLLIGLIAGGIALFLPVAAGLRSPVAVFVLFSTFTFVAGLINGIDFPLAASCCTVLTRRADKSAGSVYGVELFGACIGAGLASVVVVPILSIIVCCLMAGLANLTACGALLISRRL
jgi:spermidine synthase